MRPDVGLHSLPQRIAAINSLRPSARAAQAPAGADFAATLQNQMVTQTSGAAGTPARAFAVQRPLGLGNGVTLASGQSVITPQLPGTAAPGGGGGVGAVGGGAGAVGGVAGGGGPGPGGVVLDRTGPPPELQAYGNGQIPTSALEPVGVGDHRLWGPAARAYRDMAAAAARDGVTMGVSSSYRDLAGQQRMVERYGLYSQGGRAASPGSSNHGWGLSIDLQLDDRAQAWMRENAEQYGFVEDVAREPWHWTFKGSTY